MSRYVVTGPAAANVERIIRDIAQDDPGGAARFSESLIRTFELLAYSPRMGRTYGAHHAGLRRINEGVYAVLYRETQEGVMIVVVVHGMRDLDSIFGE